MDKWDGRTKLLVLTGLMGAIVCVVTRILPIPTPTGGYVNPGDAAVLLGAYLLGPWYGALAAGIGSALSDVLGGYPAWAPATLVIKAAVAAAAGLLYRPLRHRRGGTLVCGLAGEAIMVLGYWLFETWLLHSAAGAAAGIPGNLAQGAFGVVAAAVLCGALRKNGAVLRRFPAL